MTNYLLLGDIHLADNSPASRKEGYLDEVLGLLWQTVDLAKEHEAVAVWAGDVFHLKTPGRNSFKMVNEVIDVIKAHPRELYIVPGNHDLTHDRLDSIPSQPLGMLYQAGAVNGSGLAMYNDGHTVYGVPWLQRFTDEAVEASLADFRNEYSEEHWLVVTHAPLYPPGKELPYEFYDTHKWAAAMGNRGSVFYGHVHNPHGVYEVDGVQFCNNGALSRGSLDESNLSRDVVATMWSSVNGQFRNLPLNYKPSAEIFRMEEKTKRAAQVKLDDFLSSIGQASLEITTSSAVMDHVRSLQLGAAVEALIQDLLDSVAT